MTLLTLARSVALKLLTRVPPVDGRRQKNGGKGGGRWWERRLGLGEESFAGPRLASATARRHGISNRLLFAWRKAYREGQLGDIGGFVPGMSVASRPEKGQRTW